MDKTNTLLTMAALLGILLFLADSRADAGLADSLTLSRFAAFQRTHGRRYASPEEMEYRLGVFRDNLRLIDGHNEDGRASYTLGVTSFADLTFEEFAGGMRAQPEDLEAASDPMEREILKISANPSDNEVDWVKAGKVTPVKDQILCTGANSVFALLAAAESAYLINNPSKTPNFAEQEIVDCAPGVSCKHSFEDSILGWLFHKGFCDTRDYPYHGADLTCKDGTPIEKRAKLKKVVTLKMGCNFLMDYLRIQPVTIKFNLPPDLQHYTGGVLVPKNCRFGSIYHIVLGVGFNLNAEVPYWIMKNSWGSSWGEKGFLRMKLTTDYDENCGMCEFKGNKAVELF